MAISWMPGVCRGFAGLETGKDLQFLEPELSFEAAGLGFGTSN